MRNLLGIFTFLCMHSLMSQKPAKPIFNQKSFPKFEIVDSLSSSKNDLMYKMLGLKKKKSALIANNQTMPVFRPNYKSAMPIYGVDATSTYFIRIYPTGKD